MATLAIEYLVCGPGHDGGGTSAGLSGDGGDGGAVLTGSESIAINATYPVVVGTAHGVASTFNGHSAAAGVNGASGTAGNAAGGDGAGGAHSAETGGAGVTSSITGSSAVYGPGGGGGLEAAGNGGVGGSSGAGGHGAGDATAATAGSVYGAGGGGATTTFTTPGSRVNGIVVIRYLAANAKATGGSISSSGGYIIHTFTSSGDFIVFPDTAKFLMVL